MFSAKSCRAWSQPTGIFLVPLITEYRHFQNQDLYTCAHTHLHINSKLPYADDIDTNDIKPLSHIPTHTHGAKIHMFVLLHHTFSYHVSARENRLSPKCVSTIGLCLTLAWIPLFSDVWLGESREVADVSVVTLPRFSTDRASWRCRSKGYSTIIHQQAWEGSRGGGVGKGVLMLMVVPESSCLVLISQHIKILLLKQSVTTARLFFFLPLMLSVLYTTSINWTFGFLESFSWTVKVAMCTVRQQCVNVCTRVCVSESETPHPQKKGGEAV